MMKITIRKSHFSWMYLLGVVSTFYIVRLYNNPIVVWISLLISVISIVKQKRIMIDKIFTSYILCCGLSVISAFITKTGTAKSSFSAFTIYIIIFFFSTQVGLLGDKELISFVKGFKLSCIIQIAWSYLQMIFYYLLHVDINNALFADTLKMVTSASRYRNGVLTATGLCWHPSNLIVIIVATLLFFNNWVCWIICLVLSLFANNSTIWISFILTTVFRLFFSLPGYLRRHKISKHTMILSGLGFAIIFIIVFLNINILIKIRDDLFLLFARLSGASIDTSTSVHVSYYTSLIKVWSKFSISNVVFGFGVASSGFPFSFLYDQYSNLGAWSVESDPMNLIYGTGLIGFICFYSWIFSCVKKSLKIDIKYFIFIVTIVLCGITYNVQYVWVVIVELIVFEAIKRGLEIFK